MTDGFWRIKQFSPGSPSGIIVTEIVVVAVAAPAMTEPRVFHNDWGLEINHPDGREEYFPWASIVHAEYQPPTADESET